MKYWTLLFFCAATAACGGGKSETFRVSSGTMLPSVLPGDMVFVGKGLLAGSARRGGE